MNATPILVAALLGFAAMPIALAAAADAPPGAASCTGCHPANAGVEGPLTRLAGRDALDLVRQMQAFRSGEVPTTVMDQIAKGFSDAEVQAIAAWYAEQK